ncbi:MAG: hypothetical protein WC575_04765 [Patescibacteria group bacterium]
MSGEEISKSESPIHVSEVEINEHQLDALELRRLAFEQAEHIAIRPEDRNECGELLVSPDGPVSQLSEQEWKVVRTPAFKEFFGDWQNNSEQASKVMDAYGEPMVVYHGSRWTFDEFSKESFGKNTNPINTDVFTFVTNKKVAELYKEGKVGLDVFEGAGYPRVEIEKMLLLLKNSPELLDSGGNIDEGKFKDALAKDGIRYDTAVKHGDDVAVPARRVDFVSYIDLKTLDDDRKLLKRLYWYMQINSRLYRVFLNIKEPYIDDNQGQLLSTCYSGELYKTVETEGKHDGVIVRNAIDSGPFQSKEYLTDICIAFEPDNILILPEDK